MMLKSFIHKRTFSLGNKRLIFNQPLSGNEVCRAGGIATFMRLPFEKDSQEIDASFVGIPFDGATSFRPGTRFGPRQIRCESTLIRPYNIVTGAKPFDSIQVADIGDVNVIPYNVEKTAKTIQEFYKEKILAFNSIPLTMGGDHFITYPILKSIVEKHQRPIGLIHIDAHSDTSEAMAGERLAHGTPFRRAWEDGLLDNNKVFQIGLRGTGYTPIDFQWAKHQGWNVILAKDCWHKSLTPLMKDIQQSIGCETPIYLSFDIDAIDPSACPGTGTPEIGGLTPIQALEIIRGSRGLNIIGVDLVEVAPIYDTSGNTSLTAANLLYEMLCILPKVLYD